MPRFKLEPSALVYFPCGIGGNPLIKWSGREDSNLRPLPPERNGPSVTRWFIKDSSRRGLWSDGERSFPVPAMNLFLNLGPCLFGSAP